MSAQIRVANRKVHIYLGLALLLFTVLFSGTGLLLNRHWAFSEFWPQRQVTTAQADIRLSPGLGDLAAAREIMRQLGLKGEINKTELTASGALTIQAARPGENLKIEADLAAGKAEVERTKVNGWGVVRTLHTFIGVSMDDPTRVRDWWLTTLWSLAVDATSIGLILLTAGGLYEAWAANPRRVPGLVVLAAALASCAAFVAGLFP